MSITLELDANGLRVVDTGGQTTQPVEINIALPITKQAHGLGVTVANGVTDQVIDFGGITAGMVLLLKTDGTGEVTVKLQGGTTAIPVNKLFLLVDAGALITGAKISNASGVVVTFEVHVFG